jgi:hypothetical protein
VRWFFGLNHLLWCSYRESKKHFFSYLWGAWWIIICRLLYVVFVCVSVYHTIPWIKHLFQNGRLSLMYIVLLSPTSGNPDVFDTNTQPSASYVIVPVRTNISRRFFLRFRTPVSLLKRRSSHSVAVIRLLIFVIVSENSTDLSSSSSCHRSLRCCVPVIVQWQLQRFWRHLTHRSLCFVLAVLLSSSTPATVPLLFFVTCENSTGFDVIWNIICFVLRFLCRCWVSLQPQFAISPTG